MAKLKYRLGLDLGANSLGWCVYALDDDDEPVRIARMGVRIFSDGRDPKGLASLAAARRQARQARRRRDRMLKRRGRIMQALIEAGLMPAEEAERKKLQQIDPYALRARGLHGPLAAHEFGRALFHLCRKRGFKSSRKERGESGKEKEQEKETGKVKSAIAALKARIESAGCRTVGEYLAGEHQQRRPVRGRQRADGQYVLYLQRAMIEAEFDALWDAQQAHHPEVLTPALRDRLKDILLFQRRLRPVMPGRCLFEENDYRLPLCAPLQQRFRMLQELNHLRVKEGVGYRALTLDERNAMLGLLSSEAGTVTFSRLARIAGLGKAAAFNLESDKRKGLKGDVVGSQFRAAEALGGTWDDLPPSTREALASLVERAEEDAALIAALRALPGDTGPAKEILRPAPFELHWLDVLSRLPPLTDAQARAISNIRLPEDFGSLGRKALERIVPELERDVVTYDVAVQRAGYGSHSQLHTGEIHHRLPYYGEVLRGYTSPMGSAKVEDERRFGRIPNPTVHIGLNQLRQLVNALIRRYGAPHQIVIELAREFGLSGERRREMEKEQAENQKRNEALDAEILALGYAPNGENRLRMRLWYELGEDDALDRVCVYSGRRFSRAMLFGDDVEVDHILPFSRSLHDGIGNKVLCLRQANRDKRDRTPWEAFGHSPPGYDWAAIQERVERHFAGSRHPGARRKAEHFREDAMERFLDGRDFLARHLVDTAYLSRAARQYLSYVCPPDNVWVGNGKLTGLLRGRWGLSRMLSADGTKNRNDHRHHALDAAVVGMCSRSLIQRLSDAAQRAEAHGEQRLLESLALPWPRFRDELRDTLAKIVVSHKPDRGPEGALHNDTNYGLRGEPDRKGVPLVGRYVPIESLKGIADLDAVADVRLRERLRERLAPLSAAKDIRAALLAFSIETGVRRIFRKERLSVIPIADRRTGEPYRYVKGDSNYCYDIYRGDDGRWGGDVVSTFDANRESTGHRPTHARNGRPLVMRICKEDLLALEIEGCTRLMRVVKLTEGKITLLDHHEANVDDRARKNALNKAPSTLRDCKARLVGVDILGYVNDPGFRS